MATFDRSQNPMAKVIALALASITTVTNGITLSPTGVVSLEFLAYVTA